MEANISRLPFDVGLGEGTPEGDRDEGEDPEEQEEGEHHFSPFSRLSLTRISISSVDIVYQVNSGKSTGFTGLTEPLAR